MKYFLLLFFVVYSIFGFSQPNQKYGLLIKNLFDYNGDVMLYKNKKVIIKHYLLSEKKHKVIDSLTAEEVLAIRKETRNDNGFYFLPTSMEINGKKKKTPNHRLELICDVDTLTIDFIDIGRDDSMEEILFFPEYFKCYRDPAKKIPDWDNDSLYTAETKKYIRELLKMGFSKKVYPLGGFGLLYNMTCKDPLNVLYRYQRLDCVEKKSEIKGFTLICDQNFKVLDSSLYLRTNELPIKTSTGNVYQLYYYFQFNFGRVNEEYLLAYNLLQKFNDHALFINQHKFTGTLKLVVPQNWQNWISYNLWKLTYENGTLKKKEILKNVDPITEEVRSGPSGW